ncbi:hypothetical protein C7974DRAFT_439727 [Boeremia exigua]|uniref:uncharacterized protein n=1 Tax=Boeremia exigua TaxID=749465 RepID=UPI001E8CC313|nr:uncharacterized protein C7974DRAFT_439727 [Boeremia exigua]KAH6644406.1 hypothetical protein C7974DRAFT_439727 [Boeremia exigua]
MSAPLVPSRSYTLNGHTHTRSHGLLGLLDLVRRNTTRITTLTSISIGVIAMIEDPTCIPRLDELGIGIVATVCAGVVIYGVVGLNRRGERIGWDGEGFEDAWGWVWRWTLDKLPGAGKDTEGDKGEADTTMMFDKDGNSVFVLDQPERSNLATPIPKRDSARENAATPSLTPTIGLSHKALDRPALPEFKVPSIPGPRPMPSTPSSCRQDRGLTSSFSQSPTLSYSMVQHQLDRTTQSPVSYNTLPEINHASGLLGPSPMPSRYAIPEWKHFTGQGFHKHHQRQGAVARWLISGSSRSLEETTREIERIDEQDGGKEDLSTGKTDTRTDSKKVGEWAGGFD